MARHFGPQHMKNGYAAMGAANGRPLYKYANKKRSVAESIAAERAKAIRMANANKKK